jgi:beta-ureidopropionase / N-carbamoyl-L-amino-acid hydrolase
VLVGSPIDSQPTGGRYDGVLAALEAIEAMIGGGFRPRRTIQVVAWMDEEGSRFALDRIGSAVYAGARQLSDILDIRYADGYTVREALRRGSPLRSRHSVIKGARKPRAFLELHIEQSVA